MSNVARVASTAANTLTKPLNVEEVFSTYLYTGTGSTQTITNGIDLSGEGGLLWIKSRTDAYNHYLHDTTTSEPWHFLQSNLTDAINTGAGNEDLTISAFNSDGFVVGSASGVNNGWGGNGSDFASWTFRKAPKFFDVVTYTGTGSAQNISHNLGTTVGMLIVKRTDSTSDWRIYHRSLGGGYFVEFDTGASAAGSSIFPSDPTTTTFAVGTSTGVNASGGSYVAYLFAHNNGDGDFGPTGDQDIIKCGSYTGTAADLKITTGFEPQFVLIKNATTIANWQILDTKRGIEYDGDGDYYLNADRTAAENPSQYINIHPDGFEVEGGVTNVGANGDIYIYMAIRSPMGTPSSVSDLFDVTAYTADNLDNRLIETTNRVDFVMGRTRNQTSANGFVMTDRFMEPKYHYLGSDTTTIKTSDTDSYMGLDIEKGFKVGNDATRRLNYLDYTQIAYTWTMAPKFFDIVYYDGNGSTQTINHNLSVAPEMIWTSCLNAVQQRGVGVPSLNSGQGYLKLNEPDQLASTTYTVWSNVTASSFTLGADGLTNGSSNTYVSYLFASLDGISKVGTYTGNDSSQTIDCGFTSGARFVLIKATNINAAWCVFDTERGITSGNDPALFFDSTQAEVTSNDYIVPDNSGFALNTTNALVNGNGNTYIFYAIA